MCGIAGIANSRGIDTELVRPRLAASLSLMRNRGPDGAGEWIGGNCALGHRRLAILDLSPEAGQPMTVGRLTIVFNGEIYNFARLRRSLEKLGYRFRTQSDTEVLLRGWEQWGEGVLPRLEGMFAFAIWDSNDEVLYLARDRMGEKPLFFAETSAGSLVFASNLRALEELAGTKWPLNESSLRAYFALRWVPEPETILKGVFKLLPGHVLQARKGEWGIRRWAPLSPPRIEFRTRTEAAAELLNRLDESVSDRMVADVPVGVFLSGGLDSAAVAASATARGIRPRTFTVRFPGASSLDEGQLAALVASHLQTEHHEIHLSGRDVQEGVVATLEGLDEPFADASALPTYMLCRAVRNEATVLLSGDGGDEVLGGYRKYMADRLVAVISLPRQIRRSVVAPVIRAIGAVGPTQMIRRRARKLSAGADGDWADRQVEWIRLCANQELASLFVEGQFQPDLPQLLRRWVPADERDAITALLRADQCFGLSGQMLTKVDRMSMAASVEVRSPFLDSRVVDAANSMPGHWKVGFRRGKLVLRDALSRRLPADCFRAPKSGFDPPLLDWLRADLDQWVTWASDARRVRDQGLFSSETIQSWRQQLKNGDSAAAGKLWTLVCFQYWASRRGLYSGAVGSP